MSYDAQEQANSRPYELFLFVASGTRYALTSADAPISFTVPADSSPTTFTPDTLLRAFIEESQEVTSSQCKITVPKDHVLAQLFIGSLPAAPVAITIWGSHWGDPDTQLAFGGRIASATFPRNGGNCEMTCVTDAYLLQQKIPAALYQPQCIYVFGDPNTCTVPIASYTYSGTISAISGNLITVPGLAGLPRTLQAGYLRHGNDLRMIVDDDGAGNLTLFYGLPSMQVGDAVTAVAGCDRTYATCASFSNAVNFFGFDLVPALNPFQDSLK